ncbi:MAG: TRAP transporter small permease subunit [Hyphomicrobiaceae bacterium]
MEALWNGLTRIAKGAILAGFALLLFAALVVTAEVLVRKAIPLGIEIYQWAVGIFGGDSKTAGESFRLFVRDRMQFSGSDEISGYLFAVGTSWSLAHVLITRGHVRIDALYGSFPPAMRGWLDLVALIFLAIFVGALVERSFDVSWTNLIENNRSNTNLRIPLAWSQLPWMAGIVLFFVTIVVAILRVIAALVRGDYSTVNAIAGASSQDEEIAGELAGLGIEMPHGGKK